MISTVHFKKQIDKTQSYFEQQEDTRIDIDALSHILKQRYSKFSNPNTTRFNAALTSLPTVSKNMFSSDFSKNISIDLSRNNKHLSSIWSDLKLSYKKLIPWRKGPFHFPTFSIESEWQSDMKWSRFSSCHDLLRNKKVLDIGCGNGYYMFRMLDKAPKFILGIDPSDLTYFQFHSIQHLVQDHRLYYLPIGWNDLMPFHHMFDVCLCMGILYHHRSPIDLLKTIRAVMNPKGTVLLDTLIINGDEDVALFPKDRYAKMRNVYFIPTTTCLINMMNRVGFQNIEILSINQTDVNEQRVTAWGPKQSLVNYLDPCDPSKTCEGYPAPRRIAIRASIRNSK
tara:strand:- start:497 stop:1513 length:1017 start_codon:yes stop_codon:yes gene_type:complete